MNFLQKLFGSKPPAKKIPPGESVESLTLKAKSGHAGAMVALGVYATQGYVSLETGLHWLEEAARRKNHNAFYFLGMWHSSGTFFDKNMSKATDFLRVGSLLGNEKCQNVTRDDFQTSLSVDAARNDLNDINSLIERNNRKASINSKPVRLDTTSPDLARNKMIAAMKVPPRTRPASQCRWCGTDYGEWKGLEGDYCSEKCYRQWWLSDV